MLRTTIICFIALALQISALPKYIENLEHDLSLLPEKYKYLADKFYSKRADDPRANDNGYCCKNLQYINNDEVHTRVESKLVPQSHTVTIGYEDCNGNFNPTRPPIPIPMPNTTPSYLRLPSLFGRTTSSTPGSSGTATGCIWTAVDETVTYMATMYQTVSYLVSNSYTYCAPADYECCAGYVALNDNCIHESVVADLEYLMQLGLIGTIGKK